MMAVAAAARAAMVGAVTAVANTYMSTHISFHMEPYLCYIYKTHIYK